MENVRLVALFDILGKTLAKMLTTKLGRIFTLNTILCEWT